MRRSVQWPHRETTGGLTLRKRSEAHLLEPDGDARLVEEVVARQLCRYVVLDVLAAADGTALLLANS